MRRIKFLLFMAVCMICMLLPINAHAAGDVRINATNFPDANFRAYLLEQNYGSDGVISASEIEQITTIGVSNKGVKTLKGLEYFSKLVSLSCYGNQLSELPKLPSTLGNLTCHSNQLRELPELPSSIVYLYCANNQLSKLPKLPSSLKWLYCEENQLSELPELPSVLMDLSCYSNQLKELPQLPVSLEILFCNNNELSKLPQLSSSLQVLLCEDNQLSEMPELPSSLIEINVRNNYLRTMPKLPAGKEWDKDYCYFSPQKSISIEPKIIDGEFAFCNNSMAKLCGKKSQPMKYTFHYEDSWFEKSSNVYNHALAQMSIRTALAAANSDTPEANGDNAYYIKALMTKLGYSYDNDSIQYPKPNNWTIGYAIGSKDISQDTSVIMVAVRGVGYQGEWYSNFIVGDEGDHLGFDQASIQVGDGIAAYVNAHAGELKKNVKVWIVGFSRAAAVANLTAADLCNGFINGISSEDVFAYCFACPQGTIEKNAATDKYQNIKNIVNPIDLVPKVAMSSWGFTRYGITYYIPSAGGSSDYSSYKADMKVAYDQLLFYNGLKDVDERIDAVFALTAESSGQASAYGDIIRELAYLTGGRYNYVHSLLETNIASIVDATLGDGLSSDAEIMEAVVPGALGLMVAGAHFNDIIKQFVMVEQIYISQNPGEQLTGTLEQFGKLSTMSIAHYPELYLAWMDSLDGEYKNYNGKYLKIFVNCPVDVTVYDETNAVVGKIVSDETVGVENGIPMYIDRDGQKVIILPCDREYELELKATGNGTMTYTVEEWYEDDQNSSYVKSYYDVEIEEGDTLTGVVPEAVEEVKTQYLLLGTSGETIEPTKECSGDEVKTYTIEIMTDGNGTASATPQKLAGEYVITSAVPDKGEEFLGWYKDKELVSMEAEYRFRVESNVLLKAKFTNFSDCTVRLAGGDRYETGYLVADELKAVLGVEQFEAVIVATGKDFADALAGSYLASVKNAPILLTNGKQKNVDELHAYIQANVKEGGMVYILGGPVAVPESVEAIEGFTVKRLAGENRYDTNIKILKEAGITGNEIIAATGKDFADSLSASATKLPILLVNPKKALNDDQKAIAAKAKDGKIYIVGGELAVTPAMEAELAAIADVERVAGENRNETSVAIANKFFADKAVDKVVVAYAKTFPDGLCGGALAAAMDVPLLLTTEKKADVAGGYVAANGIKAGFVLGGTAALTDKAVMDVLDLESADEIIIQKGKCGESLEYTLNANGNLIISGSGAMYDWEDETQVPWHGERDLISSIMILDPTHIGAYAFKDCTLLTEIECFEWYNNVESIGAHAFEGCTGLKRLFMEPEYMEKLTVIGESAFEGCTGIKCKIKIGENVEVLGARAFADCTAIPSVQLSENVTAIGKNAFAKQVGITCPKGSYAYRWAEESGLKVADAESGEFEIIYTVMNAGTAKVIGYIGLPSGDVVIPDEIDGYKVTCIGEDAFAESNFTGGLTISDNVEVIEDGAFCRSGFDGHLTLSKNVKEIGSMAFNGCGFQGDLIIPDSVVKMGEDAFAFTGFKNGKLVLSKNLTEIPVNCFHYSSFGGELVIPESVQMIDDIAFIMCRNLTDVYVLSGTTQISNTAFIDFYGTPGGYDYEPKLNVTFHCPENSAVYARAEELGYTVVPLEN